jgi:hypothetical protein
MTVTAVTVKHDGWSASMTPGSQKVQTVAGVVTLGSKIDFTVVFTVKTDDRLDGPQIVAAGDIAGVNIPSIGDFYEFGNDKDENAFCKAVAPRSLGGNLWEVTCVYGPRQDLTPKDKPAAIDMKDKDGNPVDDPMDAMATVNVGLVHLKAPVVKALYSGQIWHHAGFGIIPHREQEMQLPGGPLGGTRVDPALDGHLFEWDDAIPVVNSAGTPFDPPPERDEARVRITISRNHLNAPKSHVGGFVDTVNRSDFIIERQGFLWTVSAGQCKMMSVGMQQQEWNGFAFWRVTYELHIIPQSMMIDWNWHGREFHPWRPKILDQGLVRATDQDDGDYYTAKKAGVENIVDSRGQAIAEPVLLNGKGGTLIGDPLDRSAVWLEYIIYQETEWAEQVAGQLLFNQLNQGVRI